MPCLNTCYQLVDKLCFIGCSYDIDCPSYLPNCDVNDRECFYCQQDSHCSVHRNKFCGSDGRCTDNGHKGISSQMMCQKQRKYFSPDCECPA